MHYMFMTITKTRSYTICAG